MPGVKGIFMRETESKKILYRYGITCVREAELYIKYIFHRVRSLLINKIHVQNHEGDQWRCLFWMIGFTSKQKSCSIKANSLACWAAIAVHHSDILKPSPINMKSLASQIDAHCDLRKAYEGFSIRMHPSCTMRSNRYLTWERWCRLVSVISWRRTGLRFKQQWPCYLLW